MSSGKGLNNVFQVCVSNNADESDCVILTSLSVIMNTI